MWSSRHSVRQVFSLRKNVCSGAQGRMGWHTRRGDKWGRCWQTWGSGGSNTFPCIASIAACPMGCVYGAAPRQIMTLLGGERRRRSLCGSIMMGAWGGNNHLKADEGTCHTRAAAPTHDKHLFNFSIFLKYLPQRSAHRGSGKAATIWPGLWGGL